MKMTATLSAALLIPFAAAAQPLVQPHEMRDWFSSKMEVELRLRTPPDAAGKVQTAKLLYVKYRTFNVRYYYFQTPCWNKASPCTIGSATVRVFVDLPWTGRLNVTKYVLCNASECLMPAFPAMSAQPGQYFTMGYDRLKAAWSSHPAVVELTTE